MTLEKTDKILIGWTIVFAVWQVFYYALLAPLPGWDMIKYVFRQLSPYVFVLMACLLTVLLVRVTIRSSEKEDQKDELKKKKELEELKAKKEIKQVELEERKEKRIAAKERAERQKEEKLFEAEVTELVEFKYQHGVNSMPMNHDYEADVIHEAKSRAKDKKEHDKWLDRQRTFAEEYYEEHDASTRPDDWNSFDDDIAEVWEEVRQKHEKESGNTKQLQEALAEVS